MRARPTFQHPLSKPPDNPCLVRDAHHGAHRTCCCPDLASHVHGASMAQWFSDNLITVITVVGSSLACGCYLSYLHLSGISGVTKKILKRYIHRSFLNSHHSSITNQKLFIKKQKRLLPHSFRKITSTYHFHYLIHWWLWFSGMNKMMTWLVVMILWKSMRVWWLTVMILRNEWGSGNGRCLWFCGMNEVIVFSVFFCE